LAARQGEPSRDRVSAAQQVAVFGRQQRFGGLRPRCPCHGGSSLPTTRSPAFGVTVYVSPFRSANPCISPVGEKLNAEKSTAIRAQLILEIETLPEDDLQRRMCSFLRSMNFQKRRRWRSRVPKK
jgi:hypothetical protein